MQSIIYILPELFLSITIMTLLILGVFLKNSQKIIYGLSILALIFTALLVLNTKDSNITLFNNTFIIMGMFTC